MAMIMRDCSPEKPLPRPVDVPWYSDDPTCSYECVNFPGGDYGAESFDDARLWLALDPPPAGAAGSAACIVEINGKADRIVWPQWRFGDPA